MDRRLFLTGLLGVAGTAAFAAAMPRSAEALTGDPLDDLRPPRPDAMPEWDVADQPINEGEQYAVSSGSGNNNRRRPPPSRRRRRRRYRQWRRNCYWRYGRRVCRRIPIWVWGWY